LVWMTPQEKAEFEWLRSQKMVGEWGVSKEGREWVHWEKQGTLFDVYSQVDFEPKEKRMEWDLPGHGERYANCGSTVFKGCENTSAHPQGKKFIRLSKANCHRKSCPECYSSWASKESERAVLRHTTFHVGSRKVRRIQQRAACDFRSHPPAVLHKALIAECEELIGESRDQPIHYMISPPQDLYDGKSLEAFKKLRREVMRIAKLTGFRGGDMLFHGYRLKCKLCGKAIPDYHDHCECSSLAQKVWVWSPHFHCVGYGWIDGKKVKAIHESMGWVCKNLGVRESVFFTHLYLLSHCAVSAGVHAVTWFGDLGYHADRMRDCPKPERVREVCPHCGNPLFLMEFAATDRPPPEYDEELVKKDPYALDLMEDPSDWRAL
jgi:hypothetical protein